MTVQDAKDHYWMRRAIVVAEEAVAAGERPFGCILVQPDGELAMETRGSELPNDPTHHSELRGIRMSCELFGGLLVGFSLYSTHEPCTMCCGAIVHSKLSRVVWGSARADFPMLFRERAWTAEQLLADTSTPPEIAVGVLRDECRALFREEVAMAGHSWGYGRDARDGRDAA